MSWPRMIFEGVVLGVVMLFIFYGAPLAWCVVTGNGCAG